MAVRASYHKIAAARGKPSCDGVNHRFHSKAPLALQRAFPDETDTPAAVLKRRDMHAVSRDVSANL